MLNNFTLLCVENDIDAKKYIKMMLEDDFRELYMASDGMEGLRFYKDRKPDIILTDINMPNMDGFSMIKEIRKLDKNQPIVIISAFDDRENLLEAINIGGNGFIPKPIDMDFLCEKLKYLAKKLQDTKDAQELKEKEVKSLYRLAHYDNLTKIPNKFLFELTLEQVISRAKKENNSLSLFFIDLDNFKNINDTYGHKTGDIVLQKVSQNIKKVIRDEDILARRSGDEFLLLVEGMSDKNTLGLLAEKVIEASSAPIKYLNKKINITSSIGISRFLFDADTPEELIYFADIAMYEAKKSGKCKYMFFNSKNSSKK